MYHLGLKPKTSHRLLLWVGVLGLLVLLGVGLYLFARQYLKSETTIKQSDAVVTKVTVNAPPLRLFDQADFTMQLPTDWTLATQTSKPYNLLRWQGGGKSKVGRFMEVYQDTIPANFAVNRVMPVEASGNTVAVLGEVSDNCADFTNTGGAPQTSRGTAAKWHGVDFLCDLGNYERNVVGTSSVGAINSLTMRSASGTTHKYFFTYTDNNINPDFSTFYNALGSFKLK